VKSDGDERQTTDVIVGSSRGGAVAMNIDSHDAPLVLLCPAWKNWGTATMLKPGTVIMHSRADDVIRFADSETQHGHGAKQPVGRGKSKRMVCEGSFYCVVNTLLRMRGDSELVNDGYNSFHRWMTSQQLYAERRPSRQSLQERTNGRRHDQEVDG
jgi:hypothetical protein